VAEEVMHLMKENLRTALGNKGLDLDDME
jgi:hypothetical protein